MAELATTENKSGIVFDDPVSSLDNMHREAVAKRLVAEAATRQVIVFTYDLAFLFELNRAAEDAQPKPLVPISSVSRGLIRPAIAAASRHSTRAGQRYHSEFGQPACE